MSEVRVGFREELGRLSDAVLEMGRLVGEMLGDALRALLEQDAGLAQQVRKRDELADEMDETIETTAMRLLALQHPMAGDLRIVTASLKIVTDLERIGDYAVAIARTAGTLAQEPYFKPLVDIARMAELTRNIVSDALASFQCRDAAYAKGVRDQDKAIDQLWHSLESELIGLMQQDPRVVPQASRLILVARYLERIGDHAKNICERVAFMQTGRRKPWRRQKGAGQPWPVTDTEEPLGE